MDLEFHLKSPNNNNSPEFVWSFWGELAAETTSSFALIGSSGGQQIHPVWIRVARCGKEKCAHAAYLRPSIAWFYGRNFCPEILNQARVVVSPIITGDLYLPGGTRCQTSSIGSIGIIGVTWHLPLRKTCILGGFQGSSRLFQLSTPSWTRPTPPSPYNPSATLSVASPGRVKKNRPCNMDVTVNTFWSYKSREICRKHFGNHALIFVNLSKMNRSAKVHAACTVTHQNIPYPCSRKKILPSTTIIHILGLWSHFNDQYWNSNCHYRYWLYFVVLFITILIEMLVMIPIVS